MAVVIKLEVTIKRVKFMIPQWAGAQVLWPRVIRIREDIDLTPRLLAHEMVHVFQFESKGKLSMWLSYAIAYLKSGYDNHPMEDIAYRVESQPRAIELATKMLNRLPTKGRSGKIPLRAEEVSYFAEVSQY